MLSVVEGEVAGFLDENGLAIQKAITVFQKGQHFQRGGIHVMPVICHNILGVVTDKALYHNTGRTDMGYLVGLVTV